MICKTLRCVCFPSLKILASWCFCLSGSCVSDVSGMEGLVILHQAQGSQDSTDSGSLPPSYSRLPPDGHEFPEDYVDPALAGPGDPQAQFLSRKSSASSTSSLDRNQLRANTSTKKKVQCLSLSGKISFRLFDALFFSERHARRETVRGSGQNRPIL